MWADSLLPILLSAREEPHAKSRNQCDINREEDKKLFIIRYALVYLDGSRQVNHWLG